MKQSLKFVALMILLCAIISQTFAQMQVEKLNRGLIAVRRSNNHYLSWRLLANEPYNTAFHVYRNGTKVTNTPITGATIYTDNNGTASNVYTVSPVVNGVEGERSEEAFVLTKLDGNNAAYFDVILQQPPTGTNNGIYHPNDGSVADLDGDGEYEIIIKWQPSNAQDNANSGVTANTIIDAYKLNGTRLWRIDLGPNIRSGAHYTQFMVYDFDGDGKAEMMVKTAEGTRDGTGKLINMGPAATAKHDTVYRNGSGYVLDGAEYLTVFNGETGAEMATINYNPPRGNVNDWGDNYGNRVDRFNAVVAYVDGERPTAIFQRGYYTRMTLWAVDWRNGQLTQRWFFDSNASGNRNYAGQGNHQLSVADCNGDGKHDIITGAAVIGSDGRGMHTTGWGHGDALHVAHMIKGHPTPQIFMPHESGNRGILLRHASNGATISHKPYDGDIGRGVAAPFTGGGWFFWSSAADDLFNTSGTRVGSRPKTNTTVMYNHLIWFDSTLSRETLTHDKIASWNATNSTDSRILTATGGLSNNGTKENPVLTADIFGDWREELILRTSDNNIRIWTTVMPTRHRLVTLMHDPTYRVAVAWQNSSYNQPPHPGYYIASDMDPLTEFPLNVAVVGDVSQPPEYELCLIVNGGCGDCTWAVEDVCESVVKGECADRGGTVVDGCPTSSIRNAQAAPTRYAMNVTRAGKGMFKVNYAMKNSGAVRIDLFDVKGKRVKTLVNASKDMGAHQASFSAKGLAAGMYLVKLHAGGAVLQERVMVTR